MTIAYLLHYFAFCGQLDIPERDHRHPTAETDVPCTLPLQGDQGSQTGLVLSSKKYVCAHISLHLQNHKIILVARDL